jgi:hypothetical protein
MGTIKRNKAIHWEPRAVKKMGRGRAIKKPSRGIRGPIKWRASALESWRVCFAGERENELRDVAEHGFRGCDDGYAAWRW